MLNSWATQNRIVPQDWKDLMIAVWESGPQLQWKTWWRDEARTIEQQGRATGYEISQDQILDEGPYADVERQFTFDDHTLSLCCTAALNAWDKIQESGKRSEPFTKIVQGPKEVLTTFLQRLTSAVN